MIIKITRFPCIVHLIVSHSSENRYIVLEPKTNKLYKAATEPDSQIVIEQITADVSTPAITTIESVFVEDQVIGEAIAKRCCKQFAKFNRTNTNVFISGDLTVEDFDTSILPRDPYQFKFIASHASVNIY